MSKQAVDRTGQPLPSWLLDWDDVAKSRWKDILVGNGSSRAVSDRFDYKTLCDVARSKTNPTLSHDAIKVFDALGLSDFEGVLGHLQSAESVVKALDLDATPIRDCYTVTRDALAAAVAYVHPSHGSVPEATLKRGAEFFSSFTSVFTTNYDLLLYWAIMQAQDCFGDFFWPKHSEYVFDLMDTSLIGDRTGVFYLHGALMLSEKEDGRISKLVDNDCAPVLLPRILERMGTGDLPVFISEGDAPSKDLAISGYAYLDFCRARLARSAQPLIVYGHGLGEVDAHIVRAIASSARKHIAISLWPENELWLNAERARIERLLGSDQRSLSFFDGSTLNPWAGATRPKR